MSEGSPRQRALLKALRPRLLGLSDEALARAISKWMRKAQRRLDEEQAEDRAEDFYGSDLGYRWQSWDSERTYADPEELRAHEPEATYEALEPTPPELRGRIAGMSARAFDDVVLDLIWRASGRASTNIEPFASRADEEAFFRAAIEAEHHPFVNPPTRVATH